MKQVNIKTTEETGTALKSIAAEIGRGATLVDAIVKTVPSVTSHALVTPKPETVFVEVEKLVQVEVTNPETERLAAIGRKAEALTGWRRLIAKAIGLI